MEGRKGRRGVWLSKAGGRRGSAGLAESIWRRGKGLRRLRCESGEMESCSMGSGYGADEIPRPSVEKGG